MRKTDNQPVSIKATRKVVISNSRATISIKYRLITSVITLLIWGAWSVSMIHAQTGPDVRGFNPLMILVVDTSGSMEYRTECECLDESCSNCYPPCVPGDGIKNRWAIALEALTGSWVNGFKCQPFARSDSAVFDYDFGYPIPYHQPWLCPAGVSEPCNDESNRLQYSDGILDTYRGRVDFGLMTFDSEYTYLGASSSMVTEGDFNDSLSQAAAGLYSFGPDEPILIYDQNGQPPTDGDGNWDYSTNSNRFRGANTRDRFVGHLNFPTCTNPYRFDTGIRRAPQGDETVVGGLISSFDDNNPDTINNRIQESLLGTRPYLGTPIAASLDDLYFYLKGDPEVTGDPLYACRGRYALLITDGEPDDDFRELSNCDCADAIECCMAATNGNSACNEQSFNQDYKPADKGYQCPYPKAEEVAEALLCGYEDAGCTGGVLERLFVVGFALPGCHKDEDGEVVCEPDPDGQGESQGQKIYNRLQLIAEAGSPDGEGKALFADNLQELRSTLAEVLDNIATEPISRTTPTFASSSQGVGVGQIQYQFSTGFVVGSAEKGVPWSGILERKRIEATTDSTLGYVEHDLENKDRFHEVLNQRSAARKLYSVFPKPGSECTVDANNENDVDPTSTDCTLNDYLYRGSPTAPCGDIDCTFGTDCYCEIDSASECGPNPTIPASNNCPFTAAQLGADAGNDARRAELIKWLHAKADAGDPDFLQRRATQRLGDIVFSSPAVMGRPDFTRGDESFNEFRQSAIVANRPLVVYVGSNDGILHAFSVEQFPPSGVTLPEPYNTNDGSYAEGEEMWGFIPPILAKNVDTAATQHKPMVNGTPVVKDVFLARRAGLGTCTDPDRSPEAPDEDGLCNYRTVLVAGMRDGGEGYIALDVTNPTKPRFLWQFTHEDMGLAYGRPGLGQVAIEWPRGEPGATLMERAVAILPGGYNEAGPLTQKCESFRHEGGLSSVYYTYSSTTDQTKHNHRDYVQCWAKKGRSVFIVDVKTGILIKQIDDTIFPSPVIGSPSLFHGDVGTLASRAFVSDMDGVIWRIDLSSADPHDDDSEDNWQLKGWTARPFHDMFWSHITTSERPGYKEGQPSYEPPVLSVDEKGRVVVIHGSGNIDHFEDTTAPRNYVVSLTETNVFEQGATCNPDEVVAAFNWEIGKEHAGTSYGMKPSELVTGPIDLHNGQVFFASFLAASDLDDRCFWGQSHLFAVDYIKRDENIQNPDTDPSTFYPLELTADQIGGDATNFNTYHDNKLYMGVAFVKRPQSHMVETENTDPYAAYTTMGGLAAVTESTPPIFELITLASGGDRPSGTEVGIDTQRVAGPPSLSHALSMSTSCE